MHSRRLRHKDRSQRQIQRAPVQVEAVSRRHHKGHHLPRHAQRFHLFHRNRQSCFAIRRRKRNRHRLCHRLQKSSQRNSRHQSDRQQHSPHDHRQRRLQRSPQTCQIPKHTQPRRCHRVRQCRPRSNRSEKHHYVRKLKHRLSQRFHHRQQRLSPLLPHHRQRNPKEHGEHHNLQHMQNRIHQCQLLCRQRLSRRRPRQVNPCSSLRKVNRREPNHQRKRRDDLEIHNGLHAHPPHPLQIRMPRNPAHQRGKQQRRNDRLDQPQKHQAQHPQIQRQPRSIISDLRARHHANKYPSSQRATNPRINKQRCNRCPPQPKQRMPHPRPNNSHLMHQHHFLARLHRADVG